MGLAQISAASYIKGGLFLETLKFLGLVKTSSSDDYITDSAAGATAFSTGTKTFNGAIGVGADSLSRETILEMAEKLGYKTGLISTCSITHATPASFYSHRISRYMTSEIASDFYGSGVDFAAGGGKPAFDSETLKNNQYSVYTGMENYQISNAEKCVLFFNDSMEPPVASMRNNWLKMASMAGLNHLYKSNSGVFAMIEGSQVDWGGHNNDAEYTINELLDFDECVKAVVEFAQKDGNTLVLITADHETGGLSLTGGKDSTGKADYHYATEHHTGIMVPIFAFGPHAEEFTGTMENIEVFEKMKALLKQ